MYLCSKSNFIILFSSKKDRLKWFLFGWLTIRTLKHVSILPNENLISRNRPKVSPAKIYTMFVLYIHIQLYTLHIYLHILPLICSSEKHQHLLLIFYMRWILNFVIFIAFELTVIDFDKAYIHTYIIHIYTCIIRSYIYI